MCMESSTPTLANKKILLDQDTVSGSCTPFYSPEGFTSAYGGHHTERKLTEQSMYVLVDLSCEAAV